jgi:hypothetical protein
MAKTDDVSAPVVVDLQILPLGHMGDSRHQLNQNRGYCLSATPHIIIIKNIDLWKTKHVSLIYLVFVLLMMFVMIDLISKTCRTMCFRSLYDYQLLREPARVVNRRTNVSARDLFWCRPYYWLRTGPDSNESCVCSNFYIEPICMAR